MSVEYNFATVCRTCLMENDMMKSVFGYEECLEEATKLSEMITSCASIQVVPGDGMPEQICLTCAGEVSRAFLFKKLCEKADITLRNYMKTTDKIKPLKDNQQNCCSKTKNEVALKAKFEEESDLFSPNLEKSENNEMSDVIDRDDFSDESEEDNGRVKVKKKKFLGNQNAKSRQIYKCKICDEYITGLENYRKHAIKTHPNKLQKCEICSKRFKSASLLNRHTAAAHSNSNSNSEATKACSGNTRTTENGTVLQQLSGGCGGARGRQKKKNSTGVAKKRNLPRTCTVCNKTFHFHSNLLRHMLIHTGEKPYLCNVCGKGFAQLSYLKIHSFIHTGEKPYKCNMCERSFGAPGTLMTHIRTHTGERPHVCKICGKDFPQSGYLAAHIRTHTGEKPVECKVCHRRFNQSGRLIIHMRIHSGEKPYTCTFCDRSFAVKGTLKKHIRTHTGERPYVCTVCGQAFAQSGTLATHMKPTIRITGN